MIRRLKRRTKRHHRPRRALLGGFWRNSRAELVYEQRAGKHFVPGSTITLYGI